MALKALKTILQINNVLRLFGASRTELESMDNCIQGIERKRKRALERAEKRNRAINKYGAPVLSDWEQDDRYADDKFYNKKVEECYEKSRPVKRAMGLLDAVVKPREGGLTRSSISAAS